MALSQEDLSQIVEAVLDAVNNTDHFQWVEDQMRGAAKSSANDHDEEPEDYERDDEDEDDIDDDFGEGLDDGDLDGDDLDTLTEEELSEMDDEERTDYDSLDDDDKVIYAKGRRGRHRRKTRPRKLARQTRTERYSRQHAQRNGKVADSRTVQSLQRQVENLERERRHAERYARLRELQGAGYQFELDDEFQEVKNLDDAGWQRHQRQVEKYSRVPVANGFMPVGDLPVQRGAKPDKYAKERAAKAVQIAQRDGIPYKDALEKVRAEAGE